ncbi:MAG: EamA family transporter [Pseudomonadota bacterium]|nr:EamA family transporter [Pseudomonadota bacterium]
MPLSKLSGRDLAAALVVVVVWGTNFVAMKIGLRELTPFQMGAGRYLFALLPLALVVRPPALPWKWIALYGACQGVGQFGLLFLSLRAGMSASLASVLLQTQVFFTALLGVTLLREHIGPALKGGMALAALGLACFGVNYVVNGAGEVNLPGLLLCLGAAAMWAASNIVVRLAQRAAPGFDVLGFMVWSSLVPIVPFCLLSYSVDPASAQQHLTQLSWHTWTALAYLGWLATILGYALWTGLLKRHPANRIAPFSLGVPIVGISTGMLLLGDHITLWQWAGIACIVLSLAMVVLGGSWFKTAVDTP